MSQLSQGPENEEAEAEPVSYKVLQNPRTATMDDLYEDLERVPFPEDAVKQLLGAAPAAAVSNFQGALQIPFEVILLMLVSLASFGLYRTVAMFTPMLGIPPLPWMVHLGRTGHGKSIVVWLLKQTILEVQKRVNRRRRQAKKDKKENKESPANELPPDANALPPDAEADDSESPDTTDSEQAKES